MSDTPETDAKEFDGFDGQGGMVVMADFARKLERERNQWREFAQAAVCALRHWQARGPLTTDGGHYETNKAIVEFDWLQKQFAGVIEGGQRHCDSEAYATPSDLSPSTNLKSSGITMEFPREDFLKWSKAK